MYCNVVLPYVCLYWRQEREIRQLSPNPKALSIHRWHILPFMAKGKWRQNPKWIKGTFAEEILGSIGYLHTSLSCSPKLRTPPSRSPVAFHGLWTPNLWQQPACIIQEASHCVPKTCTFQNNPRVCPAHSPVLECLHRMHIHRKEPGFFTQWLLVCFHQARCTEHSRS